MTVFLNDHNFINNPEDFILPYRLCSKTDLAVMQERYNQLRKSSYGYIIRTGVADSRQQSKW